MSPVTGEETDPSSCAVPGLRDIVGWLSGDDWPGLPGALPSGSRLCVLVCDPCLWEGAHVQLPGANAEMMSSGKGARTKT